jgi:hypothetical protein
MPTTRARRLISLLTRSKGFVLQTLGQCARGNAVTAKTSTLAVSIRVPIFGNRPASWSRTRAPWLSRLYPPAFPLPNLRQ